MDKETLDTNPNSYVFTPINISYKLHIHIMNKIIGFLDSRKMLKTFCLETKITYPPQRNVEYSLPNFYALKHHRIVYLGKIRDNIILTEYARYLDKQNVLSNNIKTTKSVLEVKEKEHKKATSKLENLKTRLRKENDPSTRLWLESDVANQEASINNLLLKVKELRNKLDNYEKATGKNLASWNSQVEIIDNAMQICSKEFTNAVARKIYKKLNYTKIKVIPPEYSKEAAKAIKGAF